MKMLVGVLGLLVATSAHATTYRATMKGVLTQRTSPGEQESLLRVGSVFTFEARFTDAYTVKTPFGYTAAGLYPLETAPFPTMKIDSPVGSMTALASESDGFDKFYTYVYDVDAVDGTRAVFRRELAGPAIAFANGRIVGFDSDLVPFGSAPVLKGCCLARGSEYLFNLGPGFPLKFESQWEAGTLSNKFTVEGSTYLYSNTYYGPSFEGEWNFENSSVTVVPEPQVWATMISGLLLTGIALRRRRELVCGSTR